MTHNSPLSVAKHCKKLHAVEATFAGTYFETLAFVRELQNKHPNVIWAHFDYQVQSYPQGQVTLEWHLLSTDKEFISG